MSKSILGAALCLLALALAGVSLARSAAHKAPAVAYPQDYRGWTHVKSMWLSTSHGLADPFAGLHHVYANAAAAKALQTKKPFPKGSKIAFDLFAGSVKNEAIVEGERKLLGVMEFQGDLRPKTGGWGFEAFAGGSPNKRLVKDDGASCFACHLGRKEVGYVFSEWRP